MDHNNQRAAAGTVFDIFAHRFVLQTASGRILADLTPKGAGRIALAVGDRVEITGEQKSSELKVSSISRSGGAPMTIEHGKPRHKPEDRGDPQIALHAVEARGFMTIGTPRRKPKHFEVLAGMTRRAWSNCMSNLMAISARANPSRPMIRNGRP